VRFSGSRHPSIGNAEADAELPQTGERLLVHPAFMPWLYDEAYTLGRTSARTGDLVQGGVDFNGLEGVGVVFEPFRPEEIF